MKTAVLYAYPDKDQRFVSHLDINNREIIRYDIAGTEQEQLLSGLSSYEKIAALGVYNLINDIGLKDHPLLDDLSAT